MRSGGIAAVIRYLADAIGDLPFRFLPGLIGFAAVVICLVTVTFFDQHCTSTKGCEVFLN